MSEKSDSKINAKSIWANFYSFTSSHIGIIIFLIVATIAIIYISKEVANVVNCSGPMCDALSGVLGEFTNIMMYLMDHPILFVIGYAMFIFAPIFTGLSWAAINYIKGRVDQIKQNKDAVDNAKDQNGNDISDADKTKGVSQAIKEVVQEGKSNGNIPTDEAENLVNNANTMINNSTKTAIDEGESEEQSDENAETVQNECLS
jgi:hypothetical protein